MIKQSEPAADFKISDLDFVPECCLLCGFYATEDVEAAQEQHRLETGHGAFDYV